MKMQGTLVVVDMQIEFKAANNPGLLAAVGKKIRLAKKLGYGVVVVEYGRSDEYDEWCGGDTHWKISQALEGYAKQTTVVKHVDDGSCKIIEAIEHYKFEKRNIYVCGVNTCACVYATVTGLCHRLPASSVYVLPDSCLCNCNCSVRKRVEHIRCRFPNACLASIQRGEIDILHKRAD